MDLADYRRQDATALADLVRRGATSPTELLEIALARADEVSDLGAVPLLFPDTAREAIARGLPRGRFTGVPFLFKDLGAEHPDYPSHDGSRLTRGRRHDTASEMALRLLRSGLVVFGRSAAPESGIGVATEAAVYGRPTRNPWNPEHTPGGSSGGAGAAVAAGILPAAHGSDGGGSVRIPASCCGLFGFKPTRARLPDGPLAGEGWAGMAIDGFLTRSVRDAAALLDQTAGPDAGQPYAAPPMAGSHLGATRVSPPRLRIAVARRRFDGGELAAPVADALEETAALLADLGHRVVEAEPDAEHARMMRAWSDIVACGTALAVRAELARLDRELGPDDLEPLSLGALAHAATLSGADYLAAVSIIHLYGRQMAPFFDEHDLLLTPTLAELPARIGRFDHGATDYLAWRLEKVWPYSPFTAAFNATGQPAMSVPLAWREGLPVGMHLAAPFGADALLMSVAAELERARPWFDRTPG